MIRVLFGIALAAASALPLSAHAATQLGDTGFNILRLISAVTILVGLVTVGASLVGFYKHQTQPTVYTIKYCVTSFIVGCVLMIPGGAYSVVQATIVDPEYQYNRSALYDGRLLSESQGDLSNSIIGQYLSNEAWATILTFLLVIGAYFFVKGIYLFKEVAAATPGQGVTISKPLAHIAGGVACMNITWVMCLFGGALNISIFC